MTRDLTKETRGISIKELRKSYLCRCPPYPWYLPHANVEASARDTKTSPSATSRGADSTSSDTTIVSMNKKVRNALRIPSKLPFPPTAMAQLPQTSGIVAGGSGIDRPLIQCANRSNNEGTPSPSSHRRARMAPRRKEKWHSRWIPTQPTNQARGCQFRQLSGHLPGGSTSIQAASWRSGGGGSHRLGFQRDEHETEAREKGEKSVGEVREGEMVTKRNREEQLPMALQASIVVGRQVNLISNFYKVANIYLRC